jgi:hypothetical protein
VFPYPSSTTTTDPTDDTPDALDARVQDFLAELEQLPPDVVLAVYTRLLTGLASKLTSAVVAKAVAAARVEPSSTAKARPTSRGQASGRKAAANDVPRADSLLRQLNDPTDPMEAWS